MEAGHWKYERKEMSTQALTTGPVVVATRMCDLESPGPPVYCDQGGREGGENYVIGSD